MKWTHLKWGVRWIKWFIRSMHALTKAMWVTLVFPLWFSFNSSVVLFPHMQFCSLIHFYIYIGGLHGWKYLCLLRSRSELCWADLSGKKKKKKSSWKPFSRPINKNSGRTLRSLAVKSPVFPDSWETSHLGGNREMLRSHVTALDWPQDLMVYCKKIRQQGRLH